jgi:hypothetical protein
MFENAPQIELDLLSEAEALVARRDEVEAAHAKMITDGEALRARWRQLAGCVPGAIQFSEGEVVPNLLPASRVQPAQHVVVRSMMLAGSISFLPKIHGPVSTTM